MNTNRTYRRIIGALLILSGAVLMWLAPEMPAGLVLLWAGILLEFIEWV